MTTRVERIEKAERAVLRLSGAWAQGGQDSARNAVNLKSAVRELAQAEASGPPSMDSFTYPTSARYGAVKVLRAFADQLPDGFARSREIAREWVKELEER